METGTTATHVSPGQEEAMRVAETFKRMAGDAADAIVNASKLSQEMEAFRQDLQEMKRDLEYVRTRNAELDRNLSDVRRQRDEAEQKLSQTATDLETAKRSLEGALNTTMQDGKAINELKAQLDLARKERDDYGLEAMKLRDDLTKANEKLAEIESFASSFLSARQPKPEMLPVMHEPEPTPPSPGPAPKRRVYSGEPDFSWDKPHTYDRDIGLYFNELEA